MGKNTLHLVRYKKRLVALIKHPFFWTLTIVGNSFILIGGFLLYHFEAVVNKSHLELLDCFLWSTGIVTTIGYNNYVPQTVPGKIVVLVLMLLGTVFVWSYMAFLVTGLLAPELASLEKDVHDFEKELHQLRLKPDEQNNSKPK